MIRKCLYTLTILVFGTSVASARSHHNHHFPPVHSLNKPYVGIATWYGRGKYIKEKTANGERFKIGAMTCASPSLPFNTILRVVDLITGKSVLVRVNDRMPSRGRDVDLTLAAANKLGIKERGKVRVRLEPVIEVANAK